MREILDLMSSPTVAQWQLAHELRKLRGDRKLSDVAKELKVSATTVSRWETGGVEGMLPGPAHLERLLQLYEQPSSEVERALALRKEARTPGWWQVSGVNRDYGTFIGLESAAQTIDLYTEVLIPGLFQTEDYIRALFDETKPEAQPDEVNAHVDVRLGRQRRWRDRLPETWVVLGEAAIRHHIGGRKVMAAQLKHLVSLIDEFPSLTVQVAPFVEGGHAALEIGSFILMDVGDLSVVYTEGYESSLIRDRPEEVRSHRKVMTRLQAHALKPNKSRAVLTEAISDFERD